MLQGASYNATGWGASVVRAHALGLGGGASVEPLGDVNRHPGGTDRVSRV